MIKQRSVSQRGQRKSLLRVLLALQSRPVKPRVRARRIFCRAPSKREMTSKLKLALHAPTGRGLLEEWETAVRVGLPRDESSEIACHRVAGVVHRLKRRLQCLIMRDGSDPVFEIISSDSSKTVPCLDRSRCG